MKFFVCHVASLYLKWDILYKFCGMPKMKSIPCKHTIYMILIQLRTTILHQPVCDPLLVCEPLRFCSLLASSKSMKGFSCVITVHCHQWTSSCVQWAGLLVAVVLGWNFFTPLIGVSGYGHDLRERQKIDSMLNT